jgi:hypothetical protein
MVEAKKPGTARAGRCKPRPCATRGPRREGNPERRRDRAAREPPKNLAKAPPARSLEALQRIALDSDRSAPIDHSLEMQPETLEPNARGLTPC